MRPGCHFAAAQPAPPRSGRRRWLVRGAQAAGERLEQRPGDLRVVAHEGAELAARDAPAAHVGVGDDVGRALAAVDQRHLAEAVVPAEPAGGTAALEDRRLALADDEEPGARRAPADHGRAAVVRALLEARGERREVVVVHAEQQRDTTQDSDRAAHLFLLDASLTSRRHGGVVTSGPKPAAP